MSYADGLLATGERIVHREKQHWLVFIWGAKWPLSAFLGGLILLFLTTQVLSLSSPWSEIFAWLSALLVIGGLALFGWHVLRYMNQEYALTNRRVIQVEGVLNKKAAESSLEKINDAQLSQSIFGRIFDFGDLDILTASESGVDRFRMIRAPIEFKKAMLDAKHEYEMDVSGRSYAGSPPLRSDTPEGLAQARPPTPTSTPTPPPAAPVVTPSAPPRTPDAAPIGDDTVSTAIPTPPAGRLTPDELTRTLASLADLRDRGAISADEYERKKDDLLSRL
ncbi:MAG: PH domain-containing protein [Candidatus Limnocylindrales bacterium]